MFLGPRVVDKDGEGVGVISESSCLDSVRFLTLRRLLEIGAAIRQTFEPVILTHLYPRSEISVQVQVLSADGGESDRGLVGTKIWVEKLLLHPALHERSQCR